MTNKIIDIRKYMPEEEPEDETSYIDAAIELLGELGANAGIIITGIVNFIMLEVEIGLGLKQYPPEAMPSLQFFNRIKNYFRMAGLRTIFEVEDCKNWKQGEPAHGYHCYNCANREGYPYKAQPDENCENWETR